jgi:hypothetical protein
MNINIIVELIFDLPWQRDEQKGKLNKNLINIINLYNKRSYVDLLKTTDKLHDKLMELWMNNEKVPVEYEFTIRNEYLGKELLLDFSYFLAGIDFNENNINPKNKKYIKVLNIYNTIKFDTLTELFCLGLDMKNQI